MSPFQHGEVFVTDDGAETCTKYGISVNALSRGLASLIQRGLLYKEDQTYFIHYRLIAYMRLKADVDYGTALHEIKIR